MRLHLLHQSSALLLLAACGTQTPGVVPAELRASTTTPLQRALAQPVSPPPRSVPAVAASRAGCREPLGIEYFFPPFVLFGGQEASADRLVRSWYSKVLSAAREPSLSCGSGRRQVFRFSSIPSFAAPTFVRVEISSREGRVWSGALSGAGGYDPGQLVKTEHRQLLESERQELAQALTAWSFWEAPTNEIDVGHDGTQWVLEG